MHARRLIQALAVSLALIAGACGGDDTPATGAAAASGGDSGVESSGGDPGTTDSDAGVTDDAAAPPPEFLDPADVNFDPAGLPTDAIAIAALTDDGLGDPPPDAYPDARYDSCAALDAPTLTQIVVDFEVIGVEPFTSLSFGPACRYRSQTHVVDVIVHDPDVVEALPEALLPIAAGDVTTSSGSLHGEVDVWSEDSFGVDTPFAWVATSGDRGVMVRNAGGTGLLIGGDIEQGWEAIAVAALDGAASLTPGDVPALGASQSDPCSVFDPADIEAAYGVAVEEEPFRGGCQWSSGFRDFSIGIDLGQPAGLPVGASEEVGPSLYCCARSNSGVTYFDEGIASFSVVVYLPEGEGATNRSDAAAIELIETIVARLG